MDRININLLKFYKRTWKNEVIIALIISLSYCVMLSPHYATDTYTAILSPHEYGSDNLALGRYSSQLVYYILRKFEFDYSKNQPYLMIMMIISFFIFAVVVYRWTLKLFHNQLSKFSSYSLLVAISIIVCNCYIQEWFAFSECAFQWSFAILFLSIAFNNIKLEKGVTGNLVVVFSLTIALGFYQGVISLFLSIALCGVFIFSRGRLSKEAINRSCVVVVIATISSVVNVASIKVFQLLEIVAETDRTGELTIDNIVNNFLAVLARSKNLLIDNCGLFPKYLSASFIILLLILTVFLVIRNKDAVLEKVTYAVLLLLSCYLAVFIPHVMTTGLWLAQRTMVSFWVLPFAALCGVLVHNHDNRYITIIAFTLSVILLAENIIQIQNITTELVSTNRADEEVAYSIQDSISKYEKVTGEQINYVAFINDVNPVGRYHFSKYAYCDTNLSAFSTSWSRLDALNFYSGKKYLPVETNDEASANNLADKDWNCFNPNEQIFFENDCVYIIKY